jgi:hypothetical protein
MEAIISNPTEHFNAPKMTEIPVLELKDKMKARAAESKEPSSVILYSEMRTFPLDSANQLSEEQTLLRTIRRRRENETASSGDQLTDQPKLTDRGENFVLHENERLIIFTIQSHLSVLKSCIHWFADGTFKMRMHISIIVTRLYFFQVCPNDFYQLFTLHGFFRSQIIPLVHGLLVGKTTADYDDFFWRIKETEEYNPESILTDFESATIKSIKNSFPNAIHIGHISTHQTVHSFSWIGCLFHFGQCIWRKLQSFSLQNQYREDKSFHSNVRKLYALPFVRVSDVVTTLKLVADSLEDDDQTDDLLGYFEKHGSENRNDEVRSQSRPIVYILRTSLGIGREHSTFPIELWNIHDRVSTNLPRSNNSIEGWHKVFSTRVSAVHPTINKLAEKIRREQSKFEFDVALLRGGQEPKPRKAIYRELDKKIQRLFAEYPNVELGDYLCSICVNMSLQLLLFLFFCK